MTSVTFFEQYGDVRIYPVQWVTQQMSKRTSRKALNRRLPFTSISGKMPSGPGLFPGRVFLRAWSSSCSSIGRLIDSMTGSWSMPSAMVKSASVGWFSESLKCSTHLSFIMSGAVRSSPSLDFIG